MAEASPLMANGSISDMIILAQCRGGEGHDY